MRVNLLGENTAAPGQKPHIRALSETKAIATGAVSKHSTFGPYSKCWTDARGAKYIQNFISEVFLFGVAMALILGEGFRSNRKEGKRRDMVADRLDNLEEAMQVTLSGSSHRDMSYNLTCL